MEKGARSILITGGGSGIGRAAALLCGARGDRVAILDKNRESAAQTARAALWLLSDKSSYVTGSRLVCDGGILAKASISV